MTRLQLPLKITLWAYIKDVQQSNFPENIDGYFSQKTIAEFKKEYGLTEITADDVGWIVHSSYMPVSSFKERYLKYDQGGGACLTVIGIVKRSSTVPDFLSSAQSFILIAGIKNRYIHGIYLKNAERDASLITKKLPLPGSNVKYPIPNKNITKKT